MSEEKTEQLKEVLSEILSECDCEPLFGEDTYGREIITGSIFEVGGDYIDQLCRIAGYRDIAHASEMLGVI